MLNTSLAGIAENEIISDDSGSAVDFKFLEVNSTFESLANLEKSEILGQTAKDVCPELIQDSNRFSQIKEVALNGGEIQLEYYAEKFQKWLKVSIVSEQKGRFTSVFQDKTKEVLIAECSLKLNQYTAETVDYDDIAESMRAISGAEYAALSVYDENEQEFANKSVAGPADELRELADLLGLPIDESKRNRELFRELKSCESKTILVSELKDLSGKALPESVVNKLQKTYNIDRIVVINTYQNGRYQVSFTLGFRKDEQLQSQYLCESYADMVDATLTRINTQQAQQQSEQKYRQIFNNSPLGIFHFDTEGVITECNDTFVNIIGSTYEALIGLNMLNLKDENIIEAVQIALKGYLSSYYGNYESVTAPKVTPVKVLFSPVISGAGKVIGGTGTVEDNSRQKKAEQKLRESEALYRNLVENINEVIYMLDDEFKITYISPNIEEVAGYDADDLIGLSFIEFIHPDDVAKSIEHFYQVPRWQHEPSDYRIKTQHGLYLWMRTHARAIFKENRFYGIQGALVNITERKITEEELRKLSEVVEQSPVSVIITNVNGDIEYVNSNFTEVTGYTFEEVQGKNPNILKSGKQSDAFYEELWQTISSGNVWQGELQNLKKNGELFTESAVISPVKNDEGEITHYAAIKEDITERNSAEEELTKIQNLLNETQRITQVGGWEYDPSAQKIIWTDEVYRIHEVSKDYNPSDVDKDIGFYTPEDQKKIDEAFWKLVNKGTPFDLELQFTSATGQNKWVRTIGQAKFSGEEIVRAYGNIMDITESKEAGDKLRMQAHMLNEIGSAIMATTPEGEIYYWNRAAERIYGWKEEEVLGKNINTVTPSETSSKQAAEIMSSLQKGESWSGEFLVKRKDGTEFPVFVTDSPIFNEKGELEGIVGISTDISEYKELHNALRESLNEKEVLLSEVHHRVKNNLAIISSMIQLQSLSEDDPALSEKLQVSVNRINAMAIIHEQLYQADSFSHIDFSENIKSLVNSVIKNMQSDAEITPYFSCAQLQLNINQAIPCSLIVNEVVTNSVKHAFIGKAEGMIEISVAEQAGEVRVVITDNGQGLPESFNQTKSGKKLGLSIIENLTRQLGGTFSYQPVKKGTDFRLTFEKTEIRGAGSNLI